MVQLSRAQCISSLFCVFVTSSKPPFFSKLERHFQNFKNFKTPPFFFITVNRGFITKLKFRDKFFFFFFFCRNLHDILIKIARFFFLHLTNWQINFVMCLHCDSRTKCNYMFLKILLYSIKNNRKVAFVMPKAFVVFIVKTTNVDALENLWLKQLVESIFLEYVFPFYTDYLI